MATKPNITLPNGQVISGSDPSYAEYASQMGGTMASTTPNQITPTTPAPISSPTIPTPAPTTTPTPEPVKTGFTADQIKGLDIAFQRQKEGKATADDEKNLAYATSKGWKPSVVVPGTLPQKDFAEALDPQKSAEISQTASNLTQFSDKQIQELNKAYQKTLNGTATDTDIKNLEYAKSKGYDPTAMTDQTGTPKEEIKEITTADRIYDLLSNMGELRSEAKKQAMKEQDLEGKSQEVAEAQSFANLLRTKIQNEGILDIKEQDVVRSKPILTSQISGQLNELSREQKLDAMILQNNYNNALVEVQIAQGNYDRAREIVKEISQDYYDNLGFQLDALVFKQEIEDKEYERMRQDLEYERGLAMEGYVHIKGASGLEGLKEEEIYRDPLTGKIYLKPEPKVEQIIDVGGRKIGLDKNGNKIRDYGSTLTPDQMLELEDAGWTFDNAGNPITPSQSDSGIFFTDANGDSWNIAGWATDQTKPQQMNIIAKKIGKLTDENLEEKVSEFTPGLTADMIKEASAQSGVSWEAIMTMVNQEAQGGLSNVAKNNNNFGGLTFNNQEWIKQFGGEKGTARPSSEGGNYIKFPTKQDGLNAMAALMASYGKVNNTTDNTTNIEYSSESTSWAESIRDGKAKLSDITSEVEKSNPGLKSEVIAVMKTLPPSESQVEEAQSFVDQLKELRDHSGLNSAVGPTAIARGFFGIRGAMSGDRDAFLGKADSLISKKALNSLIEAKSQGATFGALSDTEMNILKAAGTSLGAWSESTNKGKLKYFDVDEKTFKDELDRLIKDYEGLLSKANITQSLDSYLKSNPNKVDEYNTILQQNPNLTEEEIIQVLNN